MRDDDYSDAIDFLRQFFAHTEHPVELRAFRNRGGATASAFTRNPDEVVEYCKANDIPGWGVYFGVATRIGDPPGGGRDFLRELPALWAEIDIHKFGMAEDDAVAILVTCPLPPSVIVFSGRGLHVYWLLREPFSVTYAPFGVDAEKERVERINRNLARVFHGDINACDVTRVLRPPGTHNSKRDEYSVPGVGPVLVRLITASWVRYELEEVEEFAADCRVLIPGSSPGMHAGSDPVSLNLQNKADPELADDPFADYAAAMAMDIEGELAAMRLHDEARPVHATRVRAAASLVARGHDDEAIFERLIEITQQKVIEGGEVWSVSREREETRKLRDEIRSAHAKGWAPRGEGATQKVVQLRTGKQADPQPRAADDAEIAPEFDGLPLNDLGNALRLLKAHRAGLRYVLGIGWHLWDKRRFRYDPESGQVRRLAHDVVKVMLLSAWKAQGSAKTREKIIKFAVGCANTGRLANMLHEAEPHQAIEATELDADPMLLNCPNGTVDLRTGILRPHSQADLITKVCGTPYMADATCPQWEKFLSEIFDGDLEVVAFLQRGLGYSLTGDTREQVLFILFGTGANGKSVLLETVSAILLDYVKHSPADTWAAKAAGAPTNDIAALVGARFVSVVETEQDRHLAEALVKQATGGDKLTAKFHYKEYFSYVPQFKLWFATNHRPKIRGSDYAIWRRIMLLPFMAKFVDIEEAAEGQRIKDPDLKRKLEAEHTGILAWMVRGCLDWQRFGLKPPVAVKEATRAYQSSEDNVSGFLAECCYQARRQECAVGLLYAGYEVWCEENDEEPMPKRGFGRNLDERGFAAARRGAKMERVRKGLDLTEEMKSQARQRQADAKS